MQMEVTEKEARGIYSRRYLSQCNRFVYKYLPMILIGIALLVSLISMQYIGDWPGVLVFIILLSPAFYLFWRLTRKERKYINSQIKGE